jgi:hypothetical protein
MTPSDRLAEICRALQQAGLDALVMGGHAVRYYGVDRNTDDFDFLASAGSPDALRAALARSEMLRSAPEGPSWRPRDFARFEIGRLPDGREEWLEFWLRNHLLPGGYAALSARAERGEYGGREVGFISLADLLRSKETERETDWQDIALLEEIQDARHLAARDVQAGLRDLRSRRGFDRAASAGWFDDPAVVRAAAAACGHPVSFAFLMPKAPGLPQPPTLRHPIDDAYLAPLRSVEFGGAKHGALVEIVRRAYPRWAMDVDRADKQARLNRDDAGR